MNTKEPIVMSTLNANLCIKKKKHAKASSSCPKMFCSQLIWVLEASTVERTRRKMDRNVDHDGKCNKKYKTIRRVRERLLKVETWEKDSELHSVLHIHCVQRYTLIHKLQPYNKSPVSQLHRTSLPRGGFLSDGGGSQNFLCCSAPSPLPS